MTESIPTTWNEERDATFFGITGALASDIDPRFDSRIDRALEDLLAAESWESMAVRSIARAETHHEDRQHRDLAPVRRAAR